MSTVVALLAACGGAAGSLGVPAPSGVVAPPGVSGPSGAVASSNPDLGSGSASAGPTAASNFAIHVVNRDGPTLDLYVNDQKIAQVSCQDQGVGQPILVPGADLPPLPWVVRLVGSGGAALWQITEDGNSGPRMILIRGTTVSEVVWPGDTGGPAQSPCAT